jgi:hypothetical protein
MIGFALPEMVLPLLVRGAILWRAGINCRL